MTQTSVGHNQVTAPLDRILLGYLQWVQREKGGWLDIRRLGLSLRGQFVERWSRGGVRDGGLERVDAKDWGGVACRVRSQLDSKSEKEREERGKDLSPSNISKVNAAPLLRIHETTTTRLLSKQILFVFTKFHFPSIYTT